MKNILTLLKLVLGRQSPSLVGGAPDFITNEHSDSQSSKSWSQSHHRKICNDTVSKQHG